MFGAFSLGATIFVYFFLKETKHLNDKEKKSLYAPNEIKNIHENQEDIVVEAFETDN
jgi:hypothetical protein